MMKNTFQIYMPLKKQEDSDYLIGVASTLAVDRDTERMSENALEQMRRQILEKGINLFGNHEHGWENTLGAIREAEIIDNKLIVKPFLDDETTNPKVLMLKNKLTRGINLGLSIGGAVTKERWEFDKATNQKVKVIDGVKLYEISVVGIPSNTDAFLSLPQAITKCFKQRCPCCFSILKKDKCEICFYKNI